MPWPGGPQSQSVCLVEVIDLLLLSGFEPWSSSP